MCVSVCVYARVFQGSQRCGNHCCHDPHHYPRRKRSEHICKYVRKGRSPHACLTRQPQMPAESNTLASHLPGEWEDPLAVCSSPEVSLIFRSGQWPGFKERKSNWGMRLLPSIQSLVWTKTLFYWLNPLFSLASLLL